MFVNRANSLELTDIQRCEGSATTRLLLSLIMIHKQQLRRAACEVMISGTRLTVRNCALASLFQRLNYTNETVSVDIY